MRGTVPPGDAGLHEHIGSPGGISQRPQCGARSNDRGRHSEASNLPEDHGVVISVLCPQCGVGTNAALCVLRRVRFAF